MMLTDDQLRTYERDGYLCLPDCFSQFEIALINDELNALARQDLPGRVLERDGKTLRSLNGCHLVNELLQRVIRLPRLVMPASQLLRNDVYVYQFKINFKAPFTGEVWPWHQDFIYWHHEDGMPAPQATNVALFLDEVNEFNGPLMLISRSHRVGLVDVTPADADGGSSRADWLHHVSANLKYSLDQREIGSMLQRGDMAAPKGPAGTVLLFHPNLAHASAPNLSPFDRKMMIVTYNSVANVPTSLREVRPEFLVSRDSRPLTPLLEDRI